jgi:hypothetical protein
VANAEVVKARAAVQITGEQRCIVVPIQADESRHLHPTAPRAADSLAVAVARQRNISNRKIFRAFAWPSLQDVIIDD